MIPAVDVDVLDVECPLCHAAVGRQCTTLMPPLEYRHPHHNRERLAFDCQVILLQIRLGVRVLSCIGQDPTCPCADGLQCHYKGEDPWPLPAHVRQR